VFGSECVGGQGRCKAQGLWGRGGVVEASGESSKGILLSSTLARTRSQMRDYTGILEKREFRLMCPIPQTKVHARWDLGIELVGALHAPPTSHAR